MIKTACHARAGLIGNPSDGFYGKTIAAIVRNWRATVQIWASPELVIQPNRTHDPQLFDSLGELFVTAQREGYYGGLRLLYATCKRFYEETQTRRILLPAGNFTVRYETDIPRGVGLAGSSAIITATFRALMEFYGVPEDAFGKPVLPNLVRSVETEELGLTAGLQDRVIQTYGGCVYMDFDRERMQRDGHGLYVPLDPIQLPPLYIAYISNPSESSSIHSPIRVRWERGDPEVVAAMLQFASYAEQFRQALDAGDTDELGALMNANFDLRRQLYGDEVIGRDCLRIIRIARECGASSTFAGSGGAIIGIYRDDRHFDELSAAFAAAGYPVVKARVGGAGHGDGCD
ncbi:MAG: hypothetical protein HYU66_17505 [Armatimonadetes bacterium]|nr:hypothetical protein [Armatimonadota bacterium]